MDYKYDKQYKCDKKNSQILYNMIVVKLLEPRIKSRRVTATQKCQRRKTASDGSVLKKLGCVKTYEEDLINNSN